MSQDKHELLRTLPKMDTLLASEEAEKLREEFSPERVKELAQSVLDILRRLLLDGKMETFDLEFFWSRVEDELQIQCEMQYARVINGTGIVLHTNLGRAPLGDAAMEAIAYTATGYSNLEYDVAQGVRGSRYDHVEEILCRFTGAEAALVVNNNAAAVVLAVNTLAKDGEVVTSRGELIEIGGSFRIPEVVEASEADLVEVGTTNKTRVGDYASVVNEKTQMLLKVHPSNYRIVGFTEEAKREELVALAAEKGLVVVEDLGSGTLVNTEEYGLSHEPTPMEVLKTGIDVVTFSGDKLLGGPQAGILCGKREYIEQMKKNPLLRALRMDKLTLAALEATLRLYLNPEKAKKAIPVLAMLSASEKDLSIRAEDLASRLRKIDEVTCSVKDGEGYAGGGALPQETLSSKLVVISSSRIPVEEMEEYLRTGPVPIIGRIQKNSFVLDVRTIFDFDLDVICDCVEELHQWDT